MSKTVNKAVYVKPIVSAVELDHRQAVISACILSGMYFSGADCLIRAGITLTGTTVCAQHVRGVGAHYNGAGGSSETQPS